MASLVKSVGIVGCGTIGASWSALLLARGRRVVASDPAPNAEQKLRDYIGRIWPSLHAEKASIPAIPTAGLTFVDRLGPKELQDVDFVQENGPEKLDYKKEVFSYLDRHTRPDVVLASSSSGMPASQFIADCQVNPSRILIGHPFNPPHLIPLVEIVPHASTSLDVVDRARELYAALGKKPVVVSRECPGFLANRLQAALVHEAYSLVIRGIATASDIDAAVSDSLALRWAIQGPFLTKVLGGGGGGIDGFKHHLAHVGQAAGAWARDMREHAFIPGENSSEANLAKLVSSVETELEQLGDVDIEKQRDEFLSRVIALKSAMSEA